MTKQTKKKVITVISFVFFYCKLFFLELVFLLHENTVFIHFMSMIFPFLSSSLLEKLKNGIAAVLFSCILFLYCFTICFDINSQEYS